MRKLLVLATVLISSVGYSQVESSKKGDIEFRGNKIVEMEKYEGSAEVRPKFRLLNIATGDTILLVRFQKDYSFDWMQFWFKKAQDTIEINTSDIIKGLNYQKNLGSFLVANNLVDSTGNIDEAAFKAFAAKYNENLAEKYFKLNEANRLVAVTRFDFECDGDKLFINGKQVGVAVIPVGTGAELRGIIFKDMSNNIVVSGDASMHDSRFKGNDGKEFSLGMLSNKTNGCTEKLTFATSLLREFFRQGYYRN
jgi:hypothetical protein